jgi:hypothetical protein
VTSARLVSVGLPIRNEEQYLAETLDGLLAQDYSNLEIVISDNASTDRTSEICRSYAARDPRISYHRQEHNGGAPENFNEAFRRSSGEYFTWASGHDRRAPSAIRNCVEVLEARPEVILCYPHTLLQTYAGTTVEVTDDHLETTGLTAAQRLDMTIRDLGRCNAFHGVIRSSALRRTRLCRPCLGPDNVLLTELSVLGPVHQIEPRLFIRTENRPPESAGSAAARWFVMLAISTRGTKRPYSQMAWEHLAGVWHVSRGFARLRLSAVAVHALAVTQGRTLFYEWFPRAVRVVAAVKRRFRAE